MKAAVQIAPIVLDIANRETWPERMTRREVEAVLRISARELRRRVLDGRFPTSDDGVTWSREVVGNYVGGGIRQFESEYRRRVASVARSKAMRVVGGQR